MPHARPEPDASLDAQPDAQLDADALAAWLQRSPQAAFDAVRQAAQGSTNVLIPMKEALAAHATGGEVSNALRDVWGMYNPPDAF